MKKLVTIIILLMIVFAAYAAQDSTKVAVKDAGNRDYEKNAVDSTKITVKATPRDSLAEKAVTVKKTSKPDSLQKFVDKNGDGYNDNAPDHDSDGIPDALDKDYWALKEKNKPKPEDSTPPKVYGLDKKPGKIKTNNKPEPGRKKPGIKFKKPQSRTRGQRGKRR